jgi:hypothetical protein
MEYLIPIILVLLLVSGVVTFMVLNATKQSKPSEAQNSDDSDPKTMAASDASPLGDTTEHAGEQSEEGHTVKDPEDKRAGEGGGSARRRYLRRGGHAAGIRAARQRRSPPGLTPDSEGETHPVAPRAGAPRPSSSSIEALAGASIALRPLARG